MSERTGYVTATFNQPPGGLPDTHSEMTGSDQDARPETWQPVPPMDGCTFSGYEASTAGQYRSVDRTVNGRRYRGVILRPRPDDEGYVRVNLSCDAGKNRCPKGGKHTFTGHKITLNTFAGPCPPGMEGSHLDDDPGNNRWAPGETEAEVRANGGNLIWEPKPDNNARKPPSEPAFPCRNARDGCQGKVVNEGSRCRACVVRVGEAAGDRLRARVPLGEVAAGFGNSEEWIYKLAAEYGGYEGTMAQARRPLPLHEMCQCATCARRRQPWWQRVTLTLRSRRGRGDGQ